MRRAAMYRLLAATCVAAAGIACGGSTAVTDITGPDAQRCDTRVSTPPASVPSGGSRLTLAITAGRDCIWTAAPDVQWLQVSPGSGQGDSALTVVAAVNDSRAARAGGVVVGGARVTIRQEAAPPPEPPSPPASGPAPSPSPAPAPAPKPPPAPSPAPGPSPPAPTPPAPTPACTFELNPDQQSFDADGGNGRARLRTDPRCEWSASSSESWVDVRPQSGRGDAELQFRVDRNGSTQARSGTISAGGQSFRVEQAGAPAQPPAPACTFDISPDRRRVNADGSDEHFDVRTSSGCSWSGSSNVGWISLVTSSGTGRGRIEYRVQRNTSAQDRTGSISVGGRTHEVEQRGARP